jgi:AraC-like DNA-binding protein
MGTGPAEHASAAGANGNCHVLEINLRSTDVELMIDAQPRHSGKLAAGNVLLTRARSAVCGRYGSACDLLHLFVPEPYFERLLREAGIPDAEAKFGQVSPDPIISRLAMSLLSADELEGPGAQIYAERVADAIMTRVVGRVSTGASSGRRHGRSALLKWRQRRVADFIEANLAEPIRLQDLAEAAGLSRMHFAAQFRAATGLRPHDYVVRRRIEKAQELLRDGSIPLAQVALGVGFQTQAHFTTVFRDQVHETPGRWRQLHRAS